MRGQPVHSFALADSLHMPPPPAEPGAPYASSPAELLREACVVFLLRSTQLEQLIGSDEFYASRDELVPRLERRLVARFTAVSAIAGSTTGGC